MDDYISREALIEEINSLSVTLCGTELFGKLAKHSVVEMIYEQPAANVVEVRHGEWIVTKTERGWNCAEYPSEYTCSLCGRTEQQTEPYCHCGAKMDGERKDGAGE